MTGNQVDKVKEDEPASSAVSEQSAAIGEDDDDLMYSDAEHASGLTVTARREPLTILTLPADVHFTILKNLHIVQATCLGLTNTKLYAVLKAVHPGKIPVDPYAYSYNWAEIGLLGELISEWMKPRILWGGFVFVTPERYKELEDRDYDLGLRAQPDYIGKWQG
ncbi:hypothetical protein L207DRAFT_536049 [Hyaloscypha variabilis F]|uniref:F-box domain-containing protein n=1 Tax=Hyaloscypha variabilis (strain UAMH 11265 / GT02V1 / F) TaxID=1149755 RepID=A0A2J6R2K6_HYAVF|nr:hypothetical protein L207DRAFT_536049 [Hyaloscypha variabilis F]